MATLEEMTTSELAALKVETDGMIRRLDEILMMMVPGTACSKRDCLQAVEEYLKSIEEEVDRRRANEANLIAPDLGWPGR